MPRAGRSRSPRSRSRTRRCASTPPTAASCPPGTCPRRNGAAVLVGHGSGGSREAGARGDPDARAPRLRRARASTCSATARAAATRTGSATTPSPAVDAALDYLARRPDVDPQPDRRLRLVARRRGAARGDRARPAAARRRVRRRRAPGGQPRGQRRGSSSSASSAAWACRPCAASRACGRRRRCSTSMPRIAPRPALLIASGGDPTEIPTDEAYRDAGGANVAAVDDPQRRPHRAACAPTPRRTSGG